VSAVRDVNKGYSLRQCPLFRVSYTVAGLALKPPSRSPKSRVAALAALEEDADQESIITNISTQTKACDMADYLGIPCAHGYNWDEYVRTMRAMLPWVVPYDVGVCHG